jgi:hypothetical protein
MTPIKDDGTIDLPAEARADFARVLERHDVVILSGDRIAAPFNHEQVDDLFLAWLRTKRPAKWTTRSLITLTLITLALISLTLFLQNFLFFRLVRRQMVLSPRVEAEAKSSEVDEILASLSTGSIAFNAPEKMKLGDTTTIQLLLSPRETIDQLRQKLDAAGKKLGGAVLVADVMQATLYGRGFDVHPLAPERQAVSESAQTEWRWDITAKEPGEQELRLTISVVITVKGHEAPRVLDVYHRTIDVQVTVISQIGRLLASNWQWVVGGCGGLPFLVAGWVIARRRSSRNRKIWDQLKSAGYTPNRN